MEKKCYTMEDKPDFKNGQVVEVDFGCFGYTGNPRYFLGTVKGKVGTHVIDVWIIDFVSKIGELIGLSPYLYQALGVQHTFIVKE